MIPRQLSSKLLVGLLLALVLGVASPVMAEDSAAPIYRPAIQEDAPAVPGEMVVQFALGTELSEVERAAAAMGASVTEYNAETGLGLLTLDGDAEPVDQHTVNGAFAASGSILAAEPNYIYAVSPVVDTLATEPAWPQTIPTTMQVMGSGETVITDRPIPSQEVLAASNGASTAYPVDAWYQWGFSVIGGDLIWKMTNVSPEVAVLDSGVMSTHPELAGWVTSGKDWVNNDLIANDDQGHGTHVAGTIAARLNNKLGIPGVSNGRIYAIKVLDSRNRGNVYDLVNGIYEAANRPSVKIISMSLVGYGDSPSLYAALDYAINTKGKLVIVAAGNNNVELTCTGGWPTEQYPACYRQYFPTMIVVAASGYNEDGDTSFPDSWNEQWCRANYSNYGTYVDVAAPGTSIWSTVPTTPTYNGFDSDGYASMSGTSMATPHVAGAAARVWSLYPTYTAAQVRAKLLDGSPSLPDTASYGCTYEYTNGPTKQLWLPLGTERAGIWSTVFDADTGALIPGATVQARRGAVIVSTDTTCPTCGWVNLLNIPVNPTVKVDLWVNHIGHTTSFQKYSDWYVNSPGWYWVPEHFVLPPSTARWTFISSWQKYSYGYNTDAYLFMPNSVPNYTWLGYATPFGTSSFNAPPWEAWEGALYAAPRARLMFGSYYGDSYRTWDTIALAKNGLGSFYPGTYTFMVANNWDNDPDMDPLTMTGISDVPWSCARVWNAGVLVGVRCMDATPPSGSGQFWVVGQLNTTASTATWTWFNTLRDDTNYFTDYTGGRIFALEEPSPETSFAPIPPRPDGQ